MIYHGTIVVAGEVCPSTQSLHDPIASQRVARSFDTLAGGQQYTKAASVVHDFLHFESATWTQHKLLLRMQGKNDQGCSCKNALEFTANTLIIVPELVACAASSHESHPGSE